MRLGAGIGIDFIQRRGGATPAGEISFDDAVTGSGYPLSPVTVTGHELTDESNRVVVLFVNAIGGTTHTFVSATYNGVAMTQLAQAVSPELFGRVTSLTCFYLLDAGLPVAGTYSAQYEIDAGAYGSTAIVASYYGVEQVAPSNYETQADSNNPALSGAQTLPLTGVGANSALVGGLGTESTGGELTYTPGAGQTQRAQVASGSNSVTVSDKSNPVPSELSETPSGDYFSYAQIALELPAA